MAERGRAVAEARLFEQRLQTETALANMSQGVLMFDAEARLVLCNRRYLEIYGLSKRVIRPGCSLRRLIELQQASGTFVGEPDQHCQEILTSVEERQLSTWDFTLADDRRIHSVIQPLACGGWVATHEDVTGSLKAEFQVREQKLLLDTALSHMSHGLCMFGPDGTVKVFNARFARLMGVKPRYLEGRSLRDMLWHSKQAGKFDEDPDEFFEDLRRSAREGRAVTRIRNAPNGHVLRFIDQPTADGGWVATVEDITQQVEAQRRITQLAYCDALTGLPNRTAFKEALSAALNSAAQARQGLVIVCMDLDQFKDVNDVFGLAVGDEVLRMLARRLQEVAGESCIARLAGDHFSVIIDRGPQSAPALIAQLQSVATKPFDVDGNSICIGMSAGVAVYPDHGRDAATLLGNCEAALYRAKREGRGIVRSFEPAMDHQLRARRVLQHELRKSADLDHFVAVYQPQASIDGEVIGFEALMRWEHPTRGSVLPSVFIPLAEESGLIVRLGECILRKACFEAASWRRPLHVAVNLSPVQLRHGDLPALVHSILIESGLSPPRLELEITENVLIDDRSRALSILRRLKALGVRIVMDDFGTGYASLSYLQAFPFDKLKIDQTFVAGLENNPQSATIIRAIIGLARSLALPVVAEGVETEQQFAFLTSAGCDEIQGYLIGRPAPIRQFDHLVGREIAAARLSNAE